MLMFLTWLAFFVTAGAASGNEGSLQLSYDKFPDKTPIPALKNIIDSTVVLYKKDTYFGITNYCSGVVLKFRGRHVVQTAAHCVATAAECSQTRFVRNYHQSFFEPTGSLKLESDIIQTGFALEHECIKPVFIDKKLDIGYFEISNPINLPMQNNELAAIDFDEIGEPTIESEEILLVGHPAGYRMTVSKNCQKSRINPVNDRGAANAFNIEHNCLTIGGNSGGPLIRATDYRLIGVHIESEDFRDYHGPFEGYFEFLKAKRLKKWAVYLPALKETLAQALSGQNPPGFLNAYQTSFKPLGCNAFIIRSPSDKKNSSNLYKNMFYRMGNLLQEKGICSSYDNSSVPLIFVISIDTDTNSTTPSLYRLSDSITDDDLWKLMAENI